MNLLSAADSAMTEPMSTTTVTPATSTPPETPEAGTEAPSAPQADQGTGNTGAGVTPETGDGERDPATGQFLSREAAGYRRRLRDTEQERDQIRERLERYERAEVERIAGAAGLQVAADVWLHGASLEHLRTESGDIDAETVSGLVADIVKDRPGLQARPVGDIGIGRGASAAGTRQPEKIGLSALLKPGQG